MRERRSSAAILETLGNFLTGNGFNSDPPLSRVVGNVDHMKTITTTWQDFKKFVVICENCFYGGIRDPIP